MTDALVAIPSLVVTFGPAGAVLLLLVLVMAYGYRRDFLRKVNGLKEAHERRDKLEERMADALEANATNNEKVAGAINLLAEIVRGSQR